MCMERGSSAQQWVQSYQIHFEQIICTGTTVEACWMFLNHCSAWHICRCLYCDNLFALSALHKHFGAHFTRLTKRFPPQNSLLHSGSAGPVDQKSRRFGKFVVSRVFSGIETVRNIHRGQAWASYVRSKTHIILMQIQKVVTTLGNNMMICATLESSSIQKIMAQVTTVATTENVCACMCKGQQPLSAFRSSSTPYQAPKATNVTAKMPVKTCMALINYCIVLL